MLGENRNMQDTQEKTTYFNASTTLQYPKMARGFASVRVKEDAFDKLFVSVYFHEHVP